MYFFGLFLLFGLGVMALTMLGERGYRRFHEGRAIVAAAWGVGLAWLANLNMWTAWGIGGLRYDWVGVTLTGLALGGTALFAHSVVSFFRGLHRKFDDQAEEIESGQLRRVA